MKVGIDFDGVLFNSDRFKHELFDRIPGFDNTYEEAKDGSGFYSPSRHAETLEVPVSDIFDAVSYASECLFEEVEKLDSVDHELHIVSRGDPEFQAEKIRASGVLEHVNGFTVVQERPKDIDTGIEALVDDTGGELGRTDLRDDRLLLFDGSKQGMDELVDWIDGL